jgi:RND family efflux transporter MFP subunit
MRRLRTIAYFTLASAMLALTLHGCSDVETAAESQDSTALGPRPVKVAQVERRDFRPTVKTTGTLVPRRHAELPALVGGKIARLPVDVGSLVRRGDLLFEVRTVDYELALQRAEATLAGAEVAVEAAHRERERLDNLFDEGSATDQMRDLAVTDHDSALAAMEQARAARDQAEQALRDCTVRAPHDGVVTARYREPGEFIARGDPVIEIMDVSLLHAELELPERYAGLIPPGSSVSLGLQHRGTGIEGEVSTVNPKIETSTRTFMVKVDVDNSDGSLQAGLFCSASFPLPPQLDQLAVRVDALVRDEGRTTVWIVEDGVVASREITEGPALDGWILVRSGLEEGDLVVVEGGGGLIEGGEVVVED